MMDYLTISKQNPQFPPYLDFQILRQIGIDHLQKLAGNLWTDYNLHDPGVTILEVLCYAVTDLGYRNNLEIEDLLALKPGASENNFFTPDQVLTCNPVTLLDIRKRLIDIRGVHNAWLEKVTTYEPPIWIDTANNQLHLSVPPDQKDQLPRLNPRGLYKVYLDLDPDYHKNACGQLYRSWSDVLDEVKQVLCRYRNLCEDIYDIVTLDEEDIRLCADIELEADAIGEDVLVEIYGRVQDFLVPQLRFYTLQQLLEKHQSIAEIFAGRPARNDLDKIYKSHGFIDTQELENLTLPTILHTSDFYQDILDIQGVAAIKQLLIASSINGLPQSQESPWYLQLTEQYRPVLSLEGSTVRLFKNGLPVLVNLDEVKRRYYEQRAAYIKAQRDPYELDLTVPRGQYSTHLADHYSIHHDFPVAYGISEEGLPEPISALRQAQVQQLKGYLVFFDQLLANYLSQLSHVRDLFSWQVDATQTYFNQPIQFVGWQEILQENYLDAIGEEAETARDRKSRFLDHLLARFAESFSDYVLLNYKTSESHQDKTHLIQEKARFVQDYPVLSRDRFRAFNYCNCKAVWDTAINVSGFKKRVSRLLGIDNVQQRNLNHYKVESTPGGFILSIRCGSPEQTLTSKQAYATQSEAQAALEKLLSFALCSNYYKRLTYQYFYHYGWEVEVTYNGEPVQARYKTHFFSQVDRANALQTLLSLPPLQTKITTTENGSYSFQLITANSGDIQFTGEQRYFSEQDARDHANAIAAQIREPQNYHEILFLTSGDAERETESPSREARFTHYGYALIDHEGTVLAESSQRFAASGERDAALRRWLTTIRAGECSEFQLTTLQSGSSSSPIAIPLQEQFEFTVQPSGEKYQFVLQDAVGNPVLCSVNAYTKEEVWKNAYTFAENLFYLNRYINSGQGVGITDRNGELAAINVERNSEGAAESESSPLALFKRLNVVEPFLSTQALQIESETGSIQRYRSLLSDRNGAILLEGTQLFETAEIARDRFYQDVLGVLFEPGMRYSSTDRDRFGFGVLSRPDNCRNKVAVHPQTYDSELARDAAVNRLFLLVRTARMIITIEPQAPAYVGQLYRPDRSLLLQSTQRYASADEAWEQGNFLLELASTQVEIAANGKPDGKNFRLIDSEDAEGVYGWELTNTAKDQVLASHFYQSASDRDQAIKTVQQLVNDEGFHVLEHILLRPRQRLLDEANPQEALLPIYVKPDENLTAECAKFTIARRDPYSFWITIVLPYWSERYQNVTFRRFVERTLRSEAPAHVVLKIAWVNVRQMDQFETAYREWLEQLAQTACEDVACNLVGSLNHLIEILIKLRSVYPQGNLSSSEESRSQPNPIILNQTAIGSAHE